MPLPTPRKNESQDAFIDRCMADENARREFPDEEQRRAVCRRQWDERDQSEASAALQAASGLTRVMGRLRTTAWAILPEKLEAIGELVERRLAGENVPWLTEPQAAAGSREDEERSYMEITEDGIAVISITGTIGRRLNLIERASGGQSTEILLRDVRRAATSPAVRAILLYVDSPGGTVDGTQDLAREVRAAARKKPVHAYTDGMMASAAYWVGSAAGRITAGNTAQVGSVGVVAMHVDRSGYDDKVGRKRTYVYNGKYKRLVNDAEPLSDEGRAYMQGMIDRVYDIFVADVAENRRMDERAIRGHESRVFIAAEAVEAGLVDGVGSYAEALEQLKKEGQPMNIAELKANHPDLYQEALAEGLRQATAENVVQARPDLAEALRAEGQQAERERIREIQESAFDGQEDLVAQLVSEGVSADEGRKRLIADQKQRTQGELEQIRGNDVGDLGGNPDTTEGEGAGRAGKRTAKDRTDAGNQLDALAREIAEEKGCSYAAAFDRACKQEPQLYEAYMPAPVRH